MERRSRPPLGYCEIGRKDRHGGGSDNGGVCVYIGGALVVRALGPAHRRSSKMRARQADGWADLCWVEGANRRWRIRQRGK